MTAAIGPQQRAALHRLKWRQEILDADDKVMTSLARRGFVIGLPASSAKPRPQAEWRITFAGCVAIGVASADEPNPESMEAA